MLRRLLALAACLLLIACGKEAPRFEALPPGTAVMAFGDSVTWGTGANHGEDYPSQLAALTGWSVINAGIPGDMAQTAKQRIAADLGSHQPRLVLIELGGNDFLRRRPHAEVAEDLRTLIQAVRAAGATPVLIAVPAASPLAAAAGSLTDADLFRQLAEQEKVPLIESIFSQVLSDPALRTDPIHPNAEGYRRLAEGVATALHRFGFAAEAQAH